VEFGILSLVEHMADPVSGVMTTQQQRIDQVVESAVLAEQAGFSGIVVGEHHSPKYLGTTPAVMLAAIAARTSRIRIRSGVTLIVTLDPVRVAEDYAMVDVLSGGRLDIIVGKGIYEEPFELFGPTWPEADEALAEKVELLLRLLSETDVTWEGKFRTPIESYTTQPRPLQDPPPVWYGLGRSMNSPERAAKLGLKVMMGNVLSVPQDDAKLIEHYRECWVKEGRDPADMRLGCSSHAYVARTSQEAKKRFEQYYRHYFDQMSKAGKALLKPPPGTGVQAFSFEERIGPDGPAYCGSPAEVAEKLIERHRLLGHDEHYFQLDMAGMPWPLLVEQIELFATEVLPIVQRELAEVATA
jgi:alkanesulfonate monooxygenase SsuD/methylene tetrahydromethanopterin reductase-like flavin-dependent oxidoreductase (luciferase family)